MASWYLDLRATGGHYAPASLEQIKVFVSTIYQTDTQVTTPDLVLVNPTRQVNFAEWNPNATQLAIINEDRALRIWDARTGQKLLVINDAMDATWSPDGTKLAVRDSQGETRIVNAENGEVFDTLGTLSQWPMWSPDSTRIADVSNGVLAIWGRD